MQDETRKGIADLASGLIEALNAGDTETRDVQVKAGHDMAASLLKALPSAERDDVAGMARSWAFAMTHIMGLSVGDVATHLSHTYIAYSLAAAELAGVYPAPEPAAESDGPLGMYL